ncbi:hypothetical protein RHMOL_Rhmol10G0227100 [Rhododendron molle]|uniref:Uncharacterized protein n=1 Tax=Rhododendron molle TaxID=49168 RepID=A0ACC0M6V6_RHOML|nr:hypothetical protein RHMOL_Rhmol10G0227100 [Rhododendron molle]
MSCKRSRGNSHQKLLFFRGARHIRRFASCFRSTHPHGFVSSSPNKFWIPVPPSKEQKTVYRYEIYAPGGILVCPSMGDRIPYPAQNEILFGDGIAPRYIRSAQKFKLVILENDVR